MGSHHFAYCIVALLTVMTIGHEARADYINWNGASNFYYGKVLQFTDQEVVFQIECTGQTISVPWSSRPMSVSLNPSCTGEDPCEFCGGHPCYHPDTASGWVPGTRETFSVVLRNGARYEAAQVRFSPGILQFQDYRSGQWWQLSVGDISSIGSDHNCDEAG